MKIQSEIKTDTGNRRIARAIHVAGTIAAAAVFGTVMAVIPLSIEGPSLGYNAALAVGNGNGNGGVGQGNGRGDTNGSLGGDSSSLGSLNAARANEQGFAHANRQHSPVGALANYMEAMVAYSDALAALTEEDLALYDSLMAEYDTLIAEYEAIIAVEGYDEVEAAAKLAEADVKLSDAEAIMADVTTAENDAAGYLTDAANKDGLIDGDVVHAVNTLLDDKSTDFSDSDPAIHDAEGSVAEIINPAL